MTDPADEPDDLPESTGQDEHDDSHANHQDGVQGDRPEDHPIDGNALMLATAKASVGPARMRELLVAAAERLADRREDYRRRFEAVHDGDGTLVLLTPEGHWAEVGAELGVPDREADALRRAHEEHLRRLGSRLDRREEFETALELREAVVIGAG